MPHAWTDGVQVALLQRQLQAMPAGGVVVISSPVAPLRCPLGPYERASMIAFYLKTEKPRGKVIVLDSKDTFVMRQQFERAWAELYPGMIEWVALSDGGNVIEVDLATKTLTTDFESYKADVANVIPPQRAGRIASRPGSPIAPAGVRSIRLPSSRSSCPTFTSSVTRRSPARCQRRRPRPTRQGKFALRRSRCCLRVRRRSRAISPAVATV